MHCYNKLSCMIMQVVKKSEKIRIIQCCHNFLGKIAAPRKFCSPVQVPQAIRSRRGKLESSPFSRPT